MTTRTEPSTISTLPRPIDQADRLIELGIHELGGLSQEQLRATADGVAADDALLVIRHDVVPASALTPFLRRDGKAGFIVVDMTDVDDFAPLDALDVPASKGYLLVGLDRGDEMANWSPDEAYQSITAAGRTPLTLTEGMHWVVQQPDRLERNHCFMTIGSRRRKPDGTLDARTPALWISNGSGRDGRARRGAPKVGWCWAGNRHTWLGFASAAARVPLARFSDCEIA